MNKHPSSAEANTAPYRSQQELVHGIRGILSRSDWESENHRKAAIRRLLHEHAAGLTGTEIDELVSTLRNHFPDRVFAFNRATRDLSVRSAELDREVIALRAEAVRLHRQVDHLGALMQRLAAAAANTPAPSSPLDPRTEEALVKVAEKLFSFALNQDKAAQSVEEAVGAQDSTLATSEDLESLFSRLMQGRMMTSKDMEAVSDRLRKLQLLPGAVMAAAQQSWTGGTQAILEHLFPIEAKKGVLKARAAFKEIEQRFEQFRAQYAQNIEHYYRGRFVRAYRSKMEDRP